MTIKEKNELIHYAENLSDSELVDKYYDSVYDCLGSQSEKMYELGYDIQDIKDAEELEEYLCCESDILEQECFRRGISLWKK